MKSGAGIEEWMRGMNYFSLIQMGSHLHWRRIGAFSDVGWFAEGALYQPDLSVSGLLKFQVF